MCMACASSHVYGTCTWRAQVPTTVYTPLEYGAVGLTEEEAEAAYGPGGLKPDKGIEVTLTLALTLS